MRIRFSLLAGLGLLSLSCAQSDNSPKNSGLRIIVAPQAATLCTVSTNKNADFPDAVDRFELRVSGGDDAFSATITRDQLNDAGEILVTGVPVGKNMILDLYGCSEQELTWSGRAANLDIDKNQKTAPPLYFTRKNAFSCVGSETLSSTWKPRLTPERVMHTAVTTYDGHVLVIGGFDVFVPKSGTVQIDNLNLPSISEYRPSIGMFRPWDAQLLNPRGWHHVVPFDGGRKILVLGGVTNALIQGLDSPPIGPGRNADGTYVEGTIPQTQVEVIDVVGKTVSASGIAFDALPMSAVAHSPAGLEILVVGGELEDGEPSNKIQFVSGTVDSVASGSVASAPLVVTNDLRTPRKGHTVTWFETTNRSYALVLGGNFDEDPAHIAEIIFKPSGGGIGTAYPTIAYTSNTQEVQPMAFHQTALVRSRSCKFVFVTVGGQAARRDANKVPVFDPPHMTAPLLHLVEVDVCSQDTALLTLSDQTDVLTSVAGPASVQRSLHSLTPMGDDLLLLGGGVHRFDAPTDPDPLCFDDRVTSGCYLADSRVLHVGGSEPSDTFLEFVDVNGLTFSSARFGHNVVLLPDQTALCSGGLVARDDLGDNILSDAEIFNPRRDSEKTQEICAKIPEDASGE